MYRQLLHNNQTRAFLFPQVSFVSGYNWNASLYLESCTLVFSCNKEKNYKLEQRVINFELSSLQLIVMNFFACFQVKTDENKYTFYTPFRFFFENIHISERFRKFLSFVKTIIHLF